MNKIIIPKDVAEHLVKAAAVLKERHKRLEYLLTLYADEDPADDWEWQISMDHSEAEMMAKNLKNIADFAEFLSKFAGGQNDG